MSPLIALWIAAATIVVLLVLAAYALVKAASRGERAAEQAGWGAL